MPINMKQRVKLLLIRHGVGAESRPWRAYRAVKEIAKASPIGSLIRRRRAVAEIRRWSERDEKALVFYSQFIRAGEICFDVGANCGNRAKVFRRIGAQVIAVEPQPHCARILCTAFAGDPNVTVVEAACGDVPGRAEIVVATADTVSSMAEDWIAAVRTSGRFRGVEWKKRQACTVTTLDLLIAKYGVPAFAKIDVEGFELNVVKGLRSPIPCLSFEFTPEFITTAVDCVRYLAVLGFDEFNVSLGESMQLSAEPWFGPEEIIGRLVSYARETSLFGDVYARSMDRGGA
jgi:FkbM family methyltransferase